VNLKKYLFFNRGPFLISKKQILSSNRSGFYILTKLTYKRGFFEGLFVPSYGEKSQHDIDIPILAIHSD
jgi:hypothetical protein